jgi:hypothetical protein
MAGRHRADGSGDDGIERRASGHQAGRLKATKGDGEQTEMRSQKLVTGEDPALPQGITGHQLGRKSGR